MTDPVEPERRRAEALMTAVCAELLTDLAAGSADEPLSIDEALPWACGYGANKAMPHHREVRALVERIIELQRTEDVLADYVLRTTTELDQARAALSRRPDCPHVGLFNRYEDAQAQARFRADLTGCRYWVRFDRANRWWYLSEQVRRFR